MSNKFEAQTITALQQIPSRNDGELVWQIDFDNGKRTYIDPKNKNYALWRDVIESGVGTVVDGLVPLRKNPRVYSGDRRPLILERPRRSAHQ